MTSVALRRQRGVTLVELIIVLAVLAIAATVAANAMPHQPTLSDRQRTLAAARAIRDEAVLTGEVRSGVVSLGEKTYRVLARPDGSVLADSALGLDRYTGHERVRP